MKINLTVPVGKSRDWSIEEFVVSKKDAQFFNLRAMMKPGYRIIEPSKYKRLMYRDSVIMSNTPAEIRECEDFMEIAKGDILINGLGLGIVLIALLKKKTVKSITVIEKSKDVIKLVASAYKDERLTIINADAFKWRPPINVKYDYVWHDIWTNICYDNLVGMDKLCEKYENKTKWQDCWAKDMCLEMI